MGLLITDAMAAAVNNAPAAATDGTFSMVMIAVIFVLFYFMLIRPQNKRAKEHRELVANLQVGDEVVTNSGMLGKVMRLDSQFVTVSIAESTQVVMQRSAVSALLPKGTLKAL